MSAPVSREGVQKFTLWRRLQAHPGFSHYHRLVLLVAVVNLLILVQLDLSWPLPAEQLRQVLDVVLGNLALAIVIRQQAVINALFWCVTQVPSHWPLRLRRHLAKVYHFGGLHSGGAMAATCWFGLYAAGLLSQWPPGTQVPTPIRVTTLGILALLVLLCAMAHPGVRARWHNSFEQVHRLGGWTTLLLFWCLALLNHSDQHGEAALHLLLSTPQFWVMVLLTFCVILPWLRLRKVAVTYEHPSPHAVVARFDHGVTPLAGSASTISCHPLREWHSFANIPSPGQEGFRLIISRAGDWTGHLIDQRPGHVWVKGIATAGVARIENLFSAVIYVATGSGIGPVLPHLLAQQVPSRLIWSTRSPQATYGEPLLEEVLRAEPRALIWDTSVQGKPDLLELTLALYHSSGAEAVICIANQKLTQSLARDLERRGIAAYGAIWDS